jgi:protein-disulfide isomerase
MRWSIASLARLVAFLLVAVLATAAEDWQSATDLPPVDFTGLTAAQKTVALKILRDYDCSCGCGMKIAECRTKDPKCYYSRGLSQVIVDSIKAGKSEAEARKIAQESAFSRVQSQQMEVLEQPVEIPIGSAPVLGPKDAPITLIEFSDFQCPYCAVAAPEISALLKAFPTQIRLVFKQYPLESHPHAPQAAAASIAAGKQGKFWEMHDALFAHRTDLTRNGLLANARALGLDMAKFQADLDAPATKAQVEADVNTGDKLGIPGTPTVFVNGARYNGPVNAIALRTVLEDKFKLQGPTPAAAPAPTPAAASSPAPAPARK